MFNRVLILLSIIFLIIGCTQTSTKENIPNLLHDSLISNYREGFATYAEETKNLITDTLPKVGDSLYHYKLTSLLVSYYYNVNRLDSAIYLNKKFINYLSHADNTNEIEDLTVKAYNNLATIYLAENNKDSAIHYFNKSIETCYSTDDHKLLPNIYIYLADAYNLNGNYPDATSSYRKVLHIVDSLGVSDQYKYAIYNGLGRIYSDLKNLPQSDYYYNLVEQDWDKVPLFDRYFFSNSRGTYYYNINEYDKSLYWFHQANSFAQQLNYPIYGATVDVNLGEVHLILNNVDSAEYYINKAADIFLSPYSNNTSTEYYLNGMYAALKLNAGKLNEAEQLLTKPYDLSAITSTHIYFNDKRLEELYEKKGDYKKAYFYRKKMNVYDDSLRNITIQNNIAEIDSRYRQDTLVLKRDILIMRQQEQVSQLYNTNIITITCMVIIILLFIIIIHSIRRKREKRFARQMSKITQLRMDNVRSRVSPHFMYNVLNTVLPPLKQHTELTEPLDLLIQSIRDSLLISDKISISLDSEIKIVKNYISLRESIHNPLPQINWEITQDVDMQVMIPSMSIQIPVENAIKYAFDLIAPDNYILIKIKQNPEYVFIHIEDNGKGFSPASYTANSKGTGSGLKIMYQTIQLLNTKNQNKIVLEINNQLPDNNDRGTKVFLKIPLNYKYTI